MRGCCRCSWRRTGWPSRTRNREELFFPAWKRARSIHHPSASITLHPLSSSVHHHQSFTRVSSTCNRHQSPIIIIIIDHHHESPVMPHSCRTQTACERRGNTRKGFEDFGLKSSSGEGLRTFDGRPGHESGLGCRICAVFALDSGTSEAWGLKVCLGSSRVCPGRMGDRPVGWVTVRHGARSSPRPGTAPGGGQSFGKRNGSRTCQVQIFGRADNNLGRDRVLEPRLEGVHLQVMVRSIVRSWVCLQPAVERTAKARPHQSGKCLGTFVGKLRHESGSGCRLCAVFALDSDPATDVSLMPLLSTPKDVVRTAFFNVNPASYALNQVVRVKTIDGNGHFCNYTTPDGLISKVSHCHLPPPSVPLYVPRRRPLPPTPHLPLLPTLLPASIGDREPSAPQQTPLCTTTPHTHPPPSVAAPLGSVVEAGSYLRRTDSCVTQLKAPDLVGTVTRAKKKKKCDDG